MGFLSRFGCGPASGICVPARTVQSGQKEHRSVGGPRQGSVAICSRCHQPARGYDRLADRRFGFIPLWGFFVFLLYAMQRVDCRRCSAVVVGEVPWGDGKRTLTKAYVLLLARWPRRLSWIETAQAFRTSLDKVFEAVEHVVTWGWNTGLWARSTPSAWLKSSTTKGHKYLTLVYQIDLGITRRSEWAKSDSSDPFNLKTAAKEV